MLSVDIPTMDTRDTEILDFAVTDNVDHAEWQEIADNCSYATFFQTPSWYAAFQKTVSSLRIATKRFSFSDGKTAVLPLMAQSTSKGLHGHYITGPAGCYGGWISKDQLEVGHAAAMARWLMNGNRSVSWRINPYDELTSLLGPYVTMEDTTEVIQLGDINNEDQLRRSYKRSVRKEINKARRANITIGQADSWDQWASYFELYQANLHRWGDKATSNYPIDIFRHFFECDPRNVRLWLAYHDGRIVGGNLNFYQSRHCVEWHASFDQEYFGLGARNILVDSIIVSAMHDGYEYYDFNPSGGHEGTRKFKQSFGTVQKFSDIIFINNKRYILKILDRISKLFR